MEYARTILLLISSVAAFVLAALAVGFWLITLSDRLRVRDGVMIMRSSIKPIGSIYLGIFAVAFIAAVMLFIRFRFWRRISK
jgi:hypothetical protein